MNRKPDYHSLMGENNPLKRFPQLYDAAVDEFSQKSFEEASLNDLIRKAQMSKGSLYHHFGDKFGLYLALMDIFGQKKITFFTPLMAKALNTADFFETVKALARETMAFMFLDERLYHLSNRLLSEGPDWISKLLPYFHYDFGQGFGGLVETAIRSGQIDSRFSEEFVKKILNLLFTNMHRLTDSRNPEDMFHHLELVLDMMKSGLTGHKEIKT